VTDGLFSRDVGVKIGEVFDNIDLVTLGIPDPMASVIVVDVDETGMIHMTANGSPSGRRIIVSEKTLNERYRRR